MRLTTEHGITVQIIFKGAGFRYRMPPSNAEQENVAKRREESGVTKCDSRCHTQVTRPPNGEEIRVTSHHGVA